MAIWLPRSSTEVLAGHRPAFRVPQGGFNFDLTPYMDSILHTTLLLASMAQLYINIKPMQPHNTPNPSDEGEQDRTEETEENVEELVRKLAQLLTEAMAVEQGEATKLARVFIRVSSGGSHA